MLWLALFLPELPLQSTAESTVDVPLVLFETNAGRQMIVAINAPARHIGIEIGMTLASAESLSGSLLSIERNPKQEITALEQLAGWAQQFTSQVSLQPPNGLLLDIEASLTLFQGIESLQRCVSEAIKPLGYSASQGVAPTADAAWLLAVAGISHPIMDLKTLQSSITTLPVKLLSLSQDKLQALQSTGIKTIGECLHLSRQGLAQRFSAALLLQIDQILGRMPSPREFYQPPQQFFSQIMLPNAVQETEPLLFVLQRLLNELAGFLRARQTGAQEMQLGLIAPQQPIEYLTLSILSPSNDPAHLLKLWQEKLDQHQLTAPIEGVELKVIHVLPLKAIALDLFTTQTHEAQPFIQFLDRLRNRLGNDSIQQLHCLNDHRPEQAFTYQCYQPQPKKSSKQTASFAHRPLWLLPQPQRLKTTGQNLPASPWLQGPLKIIDGPERIESGWWDGSDQRRDYYIAHSQQEQTLWIYQNIKPPLDWYLHGLFT